MRRMCDIAQKGEGIYMPRLTPIKAIRAKCLSCCCGSIMEVRLCTVQKCPLYPYRMGHRPKGEQNTVEQSIIEKS